MGFYTSLKGLKYHMNYDHQNKVDGCMTLDVIGIFQHQFTTLFHMKKMYVSKFMTI